MTTTLNSPVVTGVTGDGRGEPALRWAARFAARTGAPLVAVHAHDPESVAARLAGAEVLALSTVLEAEEQMTADLQGEVDRLVTDLGLDDARLVVERGSPVRVLLDHQDAAVLVVGTGVKGAVEEFVLGSTSLGVSAHASCPVVVINPGVDLDSLDHGAIGVAVDGSADSRRAAAAALAMADLIGSSVTAVVTWYLEFVDGAVVTEPDSPEWQRLEADRRNLVERALAPARERHPSVPVEVVVRRGPVLPTLKEAARGWDLVVVGSRGLGGVQGRLLGSVSQRLMRSSPCPVMTVRDA